MAVLPLIAQGQDTELLSVQQVIVAEDGSSLQAVVALTGEDGRPIEGQPDFDLQVDGQRVEPGSVGSVVDESAGLSVLLLVDVSGSMAGEPLEAARTAAGAFIDKLLSNDAAAVAVFSSSPPEPVLFTTDRAALHSAVDSFALSSTPGTALHDALVEGLAIVQDAPSDRRALVVLTDGRETGASSHARDETLEAAGNAGIPIFTIALGPDVDAELLATLSAASGGRAFTAPTPADITVIFEALSEMLRGQYLITAPLAQAESANRSLVVSTEVDGEIVSAEFAFLAPQAATGEPVATGSDGSISPFVWIAPVAAVLLGLAVAWRWLRGRGPAPRRARGPSGGPGGEAARPPGPVASAPQIQRDGLVRVTGGPNAGLEVAVSSRPIDVGSGEACQLRLDPVDGAVGALHARIWLQGDRLMVHHLARDASTLLDERPVEWATLDCNEAVTIGPHRIEFAGLQP
jgi:Mg-chelatase subunit ChlD